jgi:penicillin-insensitive murein endopeptidase
VSCRRNLSGRRSPRTSVARFGLGLLSVVCLLGALRPIAAATPGMSGIAAAAAEISLRPPPGLRSRSLRFAWDGKLERGLQLHESEYVRYVGEYAAKGNFYGTWELVQLLERAARRVAFRLPGAKLSIGELSREAGGRIDGHRSHESGRDVDVGFYLTRADGSAYYTYAFAEMDARGRGLPPNQYLRFDDGRNWELVSKLLADGDARVQYVFVASHLRQRLLDEAVRRNAPTAVIERAKVALVQPVHGNPHRSHFHVRIYCAPADRGVCEDRAPFWPWYPGTPPGGQYTPLGGTPLAGEP